MIQVYKKQLPPACREQHRLWFALGAALTAAACSAGVSAPEPVHIPLPPNAPIPTLYEVREETRQLVDGSRPTPANGAAPALAQRNLPTDIRTPILQADAGADVPRIFPLVLFVHGSSSGRATSTFLLNGLAARGYLVAAADFPLTALDTPGGASDWHCEDQLGDLTFLANTLFTAAQDPADDLYGTLDAQSGFSVVGHSTGGTIAVLSAEAPTPHDARVRAAVSLSGDSCFLADSIFHTRPLPLLFLGATADQLVPVADNIERAYSLAGPPATLGVLDGGTHLFFTDFPLPDDIGGAPEPTTPSAPLAETLAAYGGGTACTPQSPGPQTLSFDEQHALTVALVADFLDSAVRADDAQLAALLEELPPALAVVQK